MIVQYKKLRDRVLAHVDLRDVFVFGGIGLIGLGLWDIYWPLAPIAVGSALLWLGLRR